MSAASVQGAASAASRVAELQAQIELAVADGDYALAAELKILRDAAGQAGTGGSHEGCVFRVEQMGIKDIDAYGHLWYGNYLKFFARAFQSFLGGGTARRVEILKYKASVLWGAPNSRIETYLVERPGPGLALVYQRWCVGDQSAESALCLTLVALPPGAGESVIATTPFQRLEDPADPLLQQGPTLAEAVEELRSGAIQQRGLQGHGPLLGQLRVMRRVFKDMLSHGSCGGEAGVLNRGDVIDLFDQSRTELVGGQAGLKALLDRGLALVVGQLDDLVLADQGEAMISPGEQVVCEVSLLREYAGRTCTDLEHRLLRAVDNCELARVRVQLCCLNLKRGILEVMPEENRQAWLAKARGD